MRQYVIARTFREFKSWCWERQIKAGDVTFVARPEQLHGVKPGQIVLLPGWEQRADHLEIEVLVQRITLTGVGMR